LGVQAPDQFQASMTVLPVQPGDQVVIMTDGFSESRNVRGEQFGEAGVERVLTGLQPSQAPFEALMAHIRQFTGKPDAADDLTLCALEIVRHEQLRALNDRTPESALSGPVDWHCVYEVRERTLADFNPLPLLLHICMEVPGLRRKSGEVYTLLSELYNNALEHGVLELPSEWKTSPDGFGHYYKERKRRLDQTNGHYIRFALSHQPTDTGGRLHVRCEDSGQGFDFDSYSEKVSEQRLPPGARYAGRGLEMLRRMTRQLKVHGRGNHVEIVYDWESTEHSESAHPGYNDTQRNADD